MHVANTPLEELPLDDDNNSVKALEIYKVSTRSKRRWGYIHVPSKELNGSTNKQKKKMRRWGFVAPVVGIPSDFPVLCSITPPIRHITKLKPKQIQHKKNITSTMQSLTTMFSSIRTQFAINNYRINISTSNTTLVELEPFERTLIHSLIALSLALVVYVAWDPRVEGDLLAVKLIEYNYNLVHYE
ncbi:1136_t:CDS:2 [Funneliformis geosporum]|uniref:1136_t:CDS:1 n=1 Tax=Funneliformis geosporum TaxID=1117311 RepID=A0A9W4T020_9GLOM|nr:1136_t:CDS:2 [Funneliformis geosporum]